MKRTFVGVLATLVLGLLAIRGLGPADALRIARTPPAHAQAVATQAAAARLVDRPLHFAANRGQAPPDVLYLSRGPHFDLRLDGSGASLALVDRRGDRSLRLRFAGAAASPSVTPERALPGRMHYFLGQDAAKWIQDVPTFGRVRYAQIYPGIDVVYYGNERRLEYDFVVAPAADPGQIRLAFDGADRLSIGTSGELLVHVGDRYLQEDPPVLYQERHGARVPVTGRYRLAGPTAVAIDVDAYDHAQPLVIDPLVLGWSTYFGGEADDWIDAAALNSKGELVVAGTMSSGTWPFARNAGLFSVGGARDVFVSRFAADGSHLSTTMLGGRGNDRAAAIAIDPKDNIYLTGSTESLEFPTTANAAMPVSESLQVTFGIGPIKFPSIKTAQANDSDAFMTRLDPSGRKVIYSTYIGGSPQIGATLKQKELNPTKLEIRFEANPGLDYGTGIAVDGNGNAYVVGSTDSSAFPVTKDAIKSELNGFFDASDAFIMKIDTNGSGADSIKFSSYLGGSCNEVATGVALDGKGHVYVTGSTDAPAVCGGFATTPGAAHEHFIGSIRDAWAIGLILDPKLNPKPGVFFSTFLGTNDANSGGKIGVDAFGNVYVTYVAGTSLTSGTLHLLKLSPDGTQQFWDRSLGTTVSGWESPSLLQSVFFPHGLFVTPLSLTTPVFAVRNDSTGPRLEQIMNSNDGGSLELDLGLHGGNVVSAISADADRIYVAGSTSGDTLSTQAAVQSRRNGGFDGFAASLVYHLPPVVTSRAVGGVVEGQNITDVIADFVNPSTVPSDFGATIEWGDGTPVDTLGGGPPSFTQPFLRFDDANNGRIFGIHTYTDWGTYTGKVCLLRNVDALTKCAAFTATIADDPPHVTAVNASVAPGTVGAVYAPSGTSGTQFALTLNQIATFQDRGVHDTHTAVVEWGDGSTSAVGVGQGQRSLQSATHVYNFSAGPAPTVAHAKACVTDRAGARDCKSFDVQVPSADLSVALSGRAAADECQVPTYQMTVKNNAGSPIDNVTVTARLSDTANASFSSATFLGANGGASAASFAMQLPATLAELPGFPGVFNEAMFGTSMAISGDTAVIGSGAGSAHVYQFSTDMLQWEDRGELAPGNDRGRQGVPATTDVAIEGDVIVRGDSTASPNESGAVIIYKRVNGVWVIAQQLTPHDPHDGNQFGFRVALRQSTMAIAGGSGAYIFTKQSDGSWTELQHLGGAGLATIALTDDGTTLFLGFPGDPQDYPPNQNAASRGTVWMYTLVNGLWTFQRKVVAGPQGFPPLVNIGDTQGHRESFGGALATQGDWLLVGAPDHTDNAAIGSEGAVYAFKRINGTWTQAGKLLASNPKRGQFFGIRVSMSGDLAVIGTGVLPGCGHLCGDGEANEAYVFQRTGDVWTQISRLHPDFVGGTDGFGQAVAIDAGRVLVGAPGKGQSAVFGYHIGAAYAFGSCLQAEPGTLTCNIGRMSAGDQMTFGLSVALGSSIVPGAPSASTAPISLSASIFGGGLDPAGANNQQSVTTTVTNTATVCNDTTPPIVASHVTGTKGRNDWYVSKVDLDWVVADPQSAFTTAGCDRASIASDTNGFASTCTATSAGGTTARTETLRVDTTPPSLHYALSPSASPTTFTVTFTCSDSGSGVGVCPGASPLSAGSAASFIATDVAGNSATVTVDLPSVSAGPPIVVAAPVGSCVASVTLQGSGLDAGGQPLTFTWTEGDQPIATGATPTVTLAAGVHHLALTVTNPGGGMAIATTDVTVNVPPVTLAGGVDEITADATGLRTPVDVPRPVATGCGVTMTDNLPADFPAGTSTVLFTATDAFDRTATGVTTVIVRPHVDAAVTLPPASIVAGVLSPYTFKVTNSGPSSVSRIDLVQHLPSGVVPTVVDTGDQVCGLDSHGLQVCEAIKVLSQDAACATTADGVKCSLFGVAPNETRSVQLSLLTPGSFARGDQTVSASLTTAEPDSNSANDSTTGTLTVTGRADLALSFQTAPPADVIAGYGANFDLRVTNNGISDSAGFSVRAQLANGLAFSNGAGCSAAGGVMTCTSGPLAAGQHTVFTVRLNVDPSARGTVTFSPAVYGLDVDPVPSNNALTSQAVVHTDVSGSAAFAAGPSSVTAGTTATLTALVSNAGRSDAIGASAEVQLSPADATVAQAPGGCVILSGKHGFTCQFANIPAGSAVAILRFTISIGQFARGAVGATVTLTTVEESASHVGQQSIAIVADVQPTLSAAAAPAKAVAGRPLTYTLTAGNTGPSGATGVRLAAPVPVGTTLTSASALLFAGSDPGTPINCSGAVTVECLAAGLGTGDRLVMTMKVAVDAGALAHVSRIAGAATVTAAESTSAVSADLGVDLTASADIAFASLVPQSSSVDAGSTFLLTASLTNNGPSDASDARIVMPIPADHSWQAPAPAVQTAGCSADATAITCSFGAIAAGAGASHSVAITVDPFLRKALQVSGQASASEPDPDGSNNAVSATVQTTARVTLGVDLSATPNPAIAGEALSYTLRVTNLGPSGATGVTATLTLPDGTSAGVLPSACTAAQQILTCSVPDIGPQSHRELYLTAHIDQFARGTGNTLTAAATAHAAEAIDATASLASPLGTRADVRVSVTAGPNPLVAGNFLKYAITVSNDGPSGAIGATLTHALPTGVMFVSASGPGATCATAHGTVTCALPRIAGGSSTSVNIVAVPSAAGLVTATSTVAVVEHDPDLSNNTAGAATMVSSPSAGPAGLGDFNGDGALDLAVSDPHRDIVHIFLNDGQGRFIERQQVAVGRKPKGLAVGDIDNDGDVDIVVADEGSNAVSILKNDGTGTFRESARVPTLGEDPVRVALGDFDGDGRLDIAVINSESDTVSLLTAAGATWMVKARLPVGGRGADHDNRHGGDRDDGPDRDHQNDHQDRHPASIAVADLDGDGRLDLAIGNEETDSVSVLFNAGGWQFAAPVEIALRNTDDPIGLAIADFDNDGDLDIAVVGKGRGRLSLLVNVNGTFTETAVVAPIEDRPVAIAAGDLNGDGRIDLAVASGDDAAVLLNAGGTFPPSLASNLEVARKKVIALMIGDVNGDGHLDIVVVDSKIAVSVWLSGRAPIERDKRDR